MDSTPELLHHGYRAEYGSLRLIVEQKQDSVKIEVFDTNTSKSVWNGDAATMQEAKDAALSEAIMSMGHNPLIGSLGLPAWKPYTDEIARL
jgi:hypothetical protein